MTPATPGTRTSWRYEVGNRNYSIFPLRENSTGFVEDFALTHLIADDNKGKNGKSKSREKERKAQGREFASVLEERPYALAAAGMPLAALPPGSYLPQVRDEGPKSRPQFMQVDLAHIHRAA